jgi:hypothetical protein
MSGSLGAQRLDAPNKTIRRMEPDQEQPSMQSDEAGRRGRYYSSTTLGISRGTRRIALPMRLGLEWGA